MKLEDVCELIVDCPHSTAKDEGIGVPLVRTPNVGKGRLVYDGMHRVSEEVYKKRIARAIPQPGDLIFAREAPAGNVALIQEGERVCLGQRTVLIRPNREKVNPNYLVYYLLSPKQQHELVCTANGATVAHVNMPNIRGLKISLPSLAKQQEIGGMLTAYDELIANCKKEIGLLEEAAQRIYREWFVNFRFPGRVIGSPLSEPAEKESTTFTDGLPDGWQETTLGEIAPFKKGKVVTKSSIGEGNIPVIAGGLGPAYYTDKSNTSNRVITISASGANAGFTRMYFEPVWASDCSFIDSTTTNEIFFVYCFLKNNIKAINNLQKGSAQPHVYAKDVNALAILCPTQEILTEFTRLVTPYFDSIAQNEKRIALLTEARDRLLPKLMSGEIDVEQLSKIE